MYVFPFPIFISRTFGLKKKKENIKFSHISSETEEAILWFNYSLFPSY